MHFLKSLGVLVILILDLITVTSLVLDQTDVFLLGITLLIKGINVFILLAVYMCQIMSYLMNNLFHMCLDQISLLLVSLAVFRIFLQSPESLLFPSHKYNPLCKYLQQVITYLLTLHRYSLHLQLPLHHHLLQHHNLPFIYYLLHHL